MQGVDALGDGCWREGMGCPVGASVMHRTMVGSSSSKNLLRKLPPR